MLLVILIGVFVLFAILGNADEKGTKDKDYTGDFYDFDYEEPDHWYGDDGQNISSSKYDYYEPLEYDYYDDYDDFDPTDEYGMNDEDMFNAGDRDDWY